MFVEIIFIIIGNIFGSFFNVVGLRLPQNKPFINDRSQCPHCNHQLTWYELIPLLSYIFQGGKCRHCKVKISPMYPLVEVLTGALFAISYIQYGFSMELIISLLLVSMLVIIFVTDINYMLIPNKVLIFFLPFFIVLRIVEPLNPWWSSITGAITGFAVIAIIILVSRGGMGAGDMKLFAVLGIVLGLQQVLLAFFLSCVIGAVIGILLILLKRIDRKQPVPFGPYIVIGTLIAYFYGDSIVSWYLTNI
ncbi:prepilin peptidase [Ornithinibacillus californiensis]|uniref:prepilin peptidase n=1 Tax=Ornithinibacillus californiensis TaxID=161536 RepID=UPI00064DAF41|nr:A24 family peptidase [Ornithinibacillus californiensis]